MYFSFIRALHKFRGQLFKVARKVLGGGYKHKQGLQSGPGLLLVSGLGFVLGQVEAYIAIPNSPPYVGKQFMALFHTNHCSAFLCTGV